MPGHTTLPAGNRYGGIVVVGSDVIDGSNVALGLIVSVGLNDEEGAGVGGDVGAGVVGAVVGDVVGAGVGGGTGIGVGGFFLEDFITFLLIGGGDGGVFLLSFKTRRRCSVVAVTAMPSMLPAAAAAAIETKRNETKQSK